MADPFTLLRVLEDVTDKHARTLRSFERALRRLRRDPGSEELQGLVLTYLRRLRVLRRRLARALGEDEPVIEGVDAEVVKNIATLSEYMVIVGYMYEEELLRKALILARRVSGPLANEAENIEDDLEEVGALVERFQRIVDKYY